MTKGDVEVVDAAEKSAAPADAAGAADKMRERVFGPRPDRFFRPPPAARLVYDKERRAVAVYTEERWLSDHADFLMGMWERTMNYVNDTGFYVLDKCRFSDFVEFVTRMTTLQPNPYAESDEEHEWE